MSFAAKYTGRCHNDDCGYDDNRIWEHDEVDYFDGELMHTNCATPARRDADRPICPDCWQYHQGECL
jgi:hypothetical protein